MEIEFLQELGYNPKLGLIENEGISLQEITLLESIYNEGNQFPTALREMLFLAGDYCEVLDFGMKETQQKMQEDARSWLPDYNREISRPFYVIDVYNAGYQFLLVYLDESQSDPIVYSVVLPEKHHTSNSWIQSIDKTLSQFINGRIDKLKRGYNPF